MEDRELMENHLLIVKGICDLYLHASIEATTQEVHTAFQDALKEELNIQNKIYNLMKSRNWYQTDEADMSKLAIAKQKYSNQNN